MIAVLVVMGNDTKKPLTVLKIIVPFKKVFNKEDKNKNILTFGLTNCGKSFFLNPLETIFKALVNPATGNYMWIGLKGCEVSYVNDFRCSLEIFVWNNFLSLLEAQVVYLPKPETHLGTGICTDAKTKSLFLPLAKVKFSVLASIIKKIDGKQI